MPWRKLLITTGRKSKNFLFMRQSYQLLFSATCNRNYTAVTKQIHRMKITLPRVAFHTGTRKNERLRSAVKDSIEADPEDLFLFGKDILGNINHKQMTLDELDNRMNQLSGILYQFLVRKDEEKLLSFFRIIDQHDMLNEAAYTILMRHFAEKLELKKVKKIFNDLLKNPNVEVHSRSYVPLIIVSLKTGKYDLADLYLQEIIENMKIKYKDQILQDVLSLCAEIRHTGNNEFIESFVNKIFMMLEEYSTNDLKPRTVDTIQEWFKSDPICTWKIESTKIDESTGVCRNCSRRLKPVEISDSGLLNLKRSLMTLIKASIVRKDAARITDVRPLKTNINIKHNIQSRSKYFEHYDIFTMDAKSKTNEETNNLAKYVGEDNFQDLSGPLFARLDQLKNYLIATGPFDVVIDALNVGYVKHGFNPMQVHDIVKHFVAQDMKILILCAGIMKEELLTAQEVPPANKRVQQLMLYLNETCNLFFVGSSVVDDYYILYTLIHHNFGIQLVSRDLFRDHLYHLDAQCTANFQRFQQSNQHILKNSRLKFNMAMQRNGEDWHVPLRGTQLLCITKKTDR
ncbi:uncharacterized protein LOC130655836 isoform X2 [Hydractinia symbiolongicarpus]|uniref:uncharacterized protein LOC130655836 isoform X2 n=1 Tax=Hydractinia symbiolongicarpus TaxID=13093 RepID=UPI00254A7D55|nr:uncharacterized protein LOC130655836 isoform X2 [Hydractinia symbiolongicarpus]